MNADQKADETATAELRELASTELAGLTRELCGPYDEWRSTVLSFRKSLAGLERLCDAATSALPEDDSRVTASAGSIIDKIVATAAANTEAAVKKVREEAELLAELTREEAEAQTTKIRAEADALVQSTRAEAEALSQKTRAEAEADSLRARAEAEAVAERARTEAKAEVSKMQGELQDERDRGRAIADDLSYAREGRQKAESALAELQRTHEGAVAAFEQQLQAARAELDAERTEVAVLRKNIDAEKIARGKLIEALQLVQRGAPAAAGDAVAAESGSAKGKNAAADSGDGVVNRPLKLVASKPGANAELERELTDYVKQLFEQIQSIYTSDAKSTEDQAVVVDRLTANLKHAHSVFGRRLESTNAGESKVFEEQLAILLDAQSQTPFGRHLAIAAYNYAPTAQAS